MHTDEWLEELDEYTQSKYANSEAQTKRKKLRTGMQQANELTIIKQKIRKSRV